MRAPTTDGPVVLLLLLCVAFVFTPLLSRTSCFGSLISLAFAAAAYVVVASCQLPPGDRRLRLSFKRRVARLLIAFARLNTMRKNESTAVCLGAFSFDSSARRWP